MRILFQNVFIFTTGDVPKLGRAPYSFRHVEIEFAENCTKHNVMSFNYSIEFQDYKLILTKVNEFLAKVSSFLTVTRSKYLN